MRWTTGRKLNYWKFFTPIKGPVLISGYDSELYNDSLHDWYRVETDCYSQIASKKREVLWMNFARA